MDNTFDKMYYGEGEFIAGIDESGVSDIAGPLVAACVILPKIDIRKDDLRIFEVNDSKKIPEKYRIGHAEIIWQTAIGIGIGEVTPTEIDALGRVEATKLAMCKAIAACTTISHEKKIRPQFLMIDKVDGINIDNYKSIMIEQGDTKSLSIAAASIVAKVYRDKVMTDLHRMYPFYDWHSNKGYPCEAHFKGIDTHGIQIGIHRIKRWPFTKNPSLQDDDIKRWEARRKKWKKVTMQETLATLDKEAWGQKQEDTP